MENRKDQLGHPILDFKDIDELLIKCEKASFRCKSYMDRYQRLERLYKTAGCFAKIRIKKLINLNFAKAKEYNKQERYWLKPLLEDLEQKTGIHLPNFDKEQK